MAADQYPYTAAATTLAVILPPALLARPVQELVEALDEPDIRAGIKETIETGLPGWENAAADPGWARPARVRFGDPRRLDGPHARRARCRAGARPGRCRLRPARRRPPHDHRRDGLHERRGRRCDPGDPVDRGLYRCRRSSTRPPDPGWWDPAPAGLWERPARARSVRPRARAPRARDGDRQAQLGAGRTARPIRSGGGPSEDRMPTSSCSTRGPSPTRRPNSTPIAIRVGIDHVVVNGVVAIAGGVETGRTAGRLLRSSR